MSSSYEKLLNTAFRFVSFRPRSEKEIVQFLHAKAKKWNVIDLGVLTNVTNRLRELGYVNDKKFVTWWIEQRQSHRPKGMRLIAQELTKKGISKDTISEILEARNNRDNDEASADYISEEEGARKAVQKKLAIWKKLPKREQKRKIYGYLGRRGFTGDSIRRVVDEVVKNEVEYGIKDC